MKVKTKNRVKSFLLVVLLVAVLLYFFTAYFVKLWNMLPDGVPKIPENIVAINQIREISVLIIWLVTIVLLFWFYAVFGWFFTVALIVTLMILAITAYRFFSTPAPPGE